MLYGYRKGGGRGNIVLVEGSRYPMVQFGKKIHPISRGGRIVKFSRPVLVKASKRARSYRRRKPRRR